MTYFQAVFLGIVQGLTEFLPVSSSGHLVIFQKLFGLFPPVLFDVLVHVGTLMAILIYFRRDLIGLLKKVIKRGKEAWRLVGLLFLGTLPAVGAGLVLEKWLVVIFDSLTLVGVSLLATAFLLFSTREFKKKTKDFNKMSWQDSLVIGFFQALAILPGISRSGATIVSGLHRKLNQKTAFIFSFYLAIPAILGALVLEIPALSQLGFSQLNQGLLGMLIAGIVGYLALSLLEKTLKQGSLWKFGFYCLILGVIVLTI